MTMPWQVLAITTFQPDMLSSTTAEFGQLMSTVGDSPTRLGTALALPSLHGSSVVTMAANFLASNLPANFGEAVDAFKCVSFPACVQPNICFQYLAYNPPPWLHIFSKTLHQHAQRLSKRQTLDKSIKGGRPEFVF